MSSERSIPRKQVASWALYDFGSSAFNTIVVTFLFSRYFASTIAGGGDAGSAGGVDGAVMWTYAVNISAVIVAVMMPLLGAMADYSGLKKRLLVSFALISVVFTVVLYFVGLPGRAMTVLVVFVIANVAFEAGNVLYNALLPEVATPKTLGRISGLGYFLGYIGGVLSLGIVYQLFSALPSDAEGAWLNQRVPLLVVAGWFLLFSLPLFFLVRERAERRRASVATYARIGFGRLAETIRHIRDLKEAAKLLIARMIYNDGLVTIIIMAGIYSDVVLGIPTLEFLGIAIALNVAAGIGALGFGFVDDWIGGKRTLVITLVALSVAGVIGVTWTSTAGFWVAAVLIGVMMGPNQSASRSLFAKLVPEHKHGEMFGLFAFSGKMSSLLGPFAYGTVLTVMEPSVGVVDAHRLALATIVIFFVVGLALLAFVQEEEGIRVADALNEEFAAGAATSASG